MTDLLLVNPLFLNEDAVEQDLMTPYFPLGLLYLAAVVRRSGYGVALYDGMFAEDPSQFAAALDRLRPRVVGIETLATVRANALRLAAMARRSGAVVVMGGPDPTCRPETYLQADSRNRGVADVVACGEAETTLIELLPPLLEGRRGADLGDIPGIAFLRPDGAVVRTSERPRIESLDSLPYPARDLLDIEAYRRAWRERHGYFSLSILTGRGCPYECAWCQKAVFGRTFIQRSPEQVADEMRMLKESFRPDHLRVVDDVMGIRQDWLDAWQAAVEERDASIPFECLCRVDLATDRLIETLKRAGCRRIAFGAESGSQRVLDAMQKGIRVPDIHSAAERCRRHGIDSYFYLMLGYPGEGWPEIRKTLALLRDARPSAYSVSVAYPLPGTPFFEQVKQDLLRDSDWSGTAENRLLFRRRYSTRFYRWVQRLMYRVWMLARVRHGEIRAGHSGWWALRVGWYRLIVEILRRIPQDRARQQEEAP